MAALDQLIAESRRRSDDNVDPPLVSNEAYALLATEAEQEACARARLLYDDSTVEVTEYAVAASQAVVDIDHRIEVITAAEFQPASGRRQGLDLTGMDRIREDADWSRRSSTRPCALVHISAQQVRIWPTPSVAGTLFLAVYRLPLSPLEALTDVPEIPLARHMALVDWMLYRVYNDKDGEQYDPERAKASLSAFEEAFGERLPADVQRRHRERRRVTTRYR